MDGMTLNVESFAYKDNTRLEYLAVPTQACHIFEIWHINGGKPKEAYKILFKYVNPLKTGGGSKGHFPRLIFFLLSFMCRQDRAL